MEYIMRFTMLLLGATAILAASANATDWTGFSGTLTEGYDYSDLNGVGNNTYTFGGEANYAVPDSHLNVQGLLAYSELKSQHVPLDTWTSGGALTWRDTDFAVGVGGNYHSQRAVGNDINYGTYGVFGEWYPTQDLTLRARAGGISGGGSTFSKDGGYYGLGANYYVLPELAFKTDFSYATLGPLHWTNFEVGPEVMPFDGIPVSLSAAYTHQNIGYYGQPSHSDGLMVRLTWHIGEGGSLAEFDRNGPLDARTATLPTDALLYAYNNPTH
jgi:hypothetical protein